jgi:hypothetical protein
MKTTNRKMKMKLKRETLRTLSASQLGAAPGGGLLGDLARSIWGALTANICPSGGDDTSDSVSGVRG